MIVQLLLFDILDELHADFKKFVWTAMHSEYFSV